MVSVIDQQQCLQEVHSPKSICLGCGPSNEQGLHVRSFVSADQSGLVSRWRAQPHHQAFPGMLNGGIIGALLDCHSNWTAAWHLMNQTQSTSPPCTVTADFAVKLLRPTPLDSEIELFARVIHSESDRATIEATLTAAGRVCATCKGTFVAVKPGHPAYHRW